MKKILLKGLTLALVSLCSFLNFQSFGQTITAQPSDQTVCFAETAKFSVTASGTGLSYQWQEDDGSGFKNLTDQYPYYSNTKTNSVYITAIGKSKNGYKYACIVTSSSTLTSLTSNSATLTVRDSVFAYIPPQDTFSCAGGSMTFRTETQGTLPITYEWIKGNSTLRSITSNSLVDSFTLKNITALDTGTYVLKVYNGCYSGVSYNFKLKLGGPKITSQPQNQGVCSGNFASLGVSASGIGTLSYQWQIDKGSGFTNIPGATTSSYSYGPLTGSDDNTIFRVVVSDNSGCQTTSANRTLTVTSSTVITFLNADQLLCAGSTLNLAVVAAGQAPYLYVWKKNGTVVKSISNTTSNNDTYIVPAIGANDAGSYTVDITSACGSITSNPITVSIRGVTVNNQPASLTVCENTNANFAVIATGISGPLTYQWQKGNLGTFVNIPEATSSTINLSNLSFNDNGSQIQVIVKDDFTCPVTSSAATLTINPSTSIKSISTNKNLCIGDPLNLTISVNGTTPFSYQWYKGGTLIQTTSVVNTSSDDYLVPSVSMTDQGDYSIMVTSLYCGTVTSNPIKVSIGNPSITSQPSDRTICQGNTADFNVTATGQSGILTYQWSTLSANTWVDLPGEISSHLSLAGTSNQDGSNYRVVVKENASCPDTSNAATLTVLKNPIITTLTSSQYLTPGDPLNLSVSALGSGVLSYEWFKNGTSLGTPSTNNFYNVPSSALDDSGNYTVNVTNSCNSFTSNPITVLVSSITKQPGDSTAKEGDPVTLSVTTNLSPVTYQWQVSDASSLKLTASSSLVFTDLVNNSVYSNVDGPDLHISNASYTMNGNVYRCKITSTYGDEYSKEATLTVTKISGINNGQGLANLSYYPNPVTSTLFIQGIETTSTATIMDLSGKIQKSETLEVGRNLSVEDLNDGLYILEIKNSTGTSRVPLVIKK